MTLSAELIEAMTALLGSPPRDVRAIGGGDISSAARFTVGDGIYLLKWHARPPKPPAGWPDMFTAEAQGLRLLREAQALNIPQCFAHQDVQGPRPAFILLEWIGTGEPTDRRRAAERLGVKLAQLHRVTIPFYGLDINNYCGLTPQNNQFLKSWVAFYGERRLGFQLELAARKGLMPPKRRKLLERLIGRLGELIDDAAVRPALLHGDLWGGNWLVGPGDEPALIDPAVYFGDREAELAMCRLFGGFPDAFYAAYDEAWPPAPGRAERVALYQLYHLLNHLNLFGEGYGGQVDDVLRQYA